VSLLKFRPHLPIPSSGGSLLSDPQQMFRRLADATAGDYDILGELGRGGMATVFLAHDLALDRRVAIKVMAPQLAAVDGMAERFLLEARVAAALSHPHIVPIHAVRRSGDLLYFVMQYVAGRSLDVVLAQSGPLSVPMVRAVLTQVGAALEAAHRRGIVHRDVKPANILIDARGDAVVADFGIARVEERRGTTQVGQTVGTPEYMSPEQCAGAALTGAADQYSLGVVAYELLTGAPPFTGDGLMQVVWRMVNEEIVPLERLRPECAGSVADTVHRMLAHDATDRWSTVAAAVAALPPLVLAPGDPVRDELIALAMQERRAPSTGAPSAGEPSTGAPTAILAAAPVDAASDDPGPTAVVTTVRLPFDSGVMTIDDEVTVPVELLAADGRAVGDAVPEWSVSDPTVVRVSAEGRLTALRTGSARVRVVAGAASAQLELTVTRSGLRDLGITPRPAMLEVGDRLALSVTGGADPAALRRRLVRWQSSDSRIARIDASGRVTALAEGTVEIVASAGGGRSALALRIARTVIASVHVTSPASRLAIGERMLLQAEPANPKGHPLEGYAVRWEVSDPAIAAISPSGVLTALRSGQVLVAARVEGRVGLAKFQVSPPER